MHENVEIPLESHPSGIFYDLFLLFTEDIQHRRTSGDDRLTTYLHDLTKKLIAINEEGLQGEEDPQFE